MSRICCPPVFTLTGPLAAFLIVGLLLLFMSLSERRAATRAAIATTVTTARMAHSQIRPMVFMELELVKPETVAEISAKRWLMRQRASRFGRSCQFTGWGNGNETDHATY